MQSQKWGVGKTAILNRLITNTFSMGVAPTLAVAHSTITVQVRGDPVDLVIWDTAGGEGFGAFIRMYCRSARWGSLSFRRSILSHLKASRGGGIAFTKVVIAGRLSSFIDKANLCESTATKIHEVRTQLREWEYVYYALARTGDCVDQVFVQGAPSQWSLHDKSCAVDSIRNPISTLSFQN
jgi:hypothetical protein